MLPCSLVAQDSTSSEELGLVRKRFLEALSKLKSTHVSQADKTDQLIEDIRRKISTQPLSNDVIHKLSKACTPIVGHAKAVPLVESLLLVPFELTSRSPLSDVLADEFLTAVCEAIYVHGVEFSYTSKCRLWCIHFKSFKNEVDAFLDHLRDLAKQPALSREVLRGHHVIKACQTHMHLRFYLHDSLQRMWTTFSATVNQLPDSIQCR
jgi:hypothetical protein